MNESTRIQRYGPLLAIPEAPLVQLASSIADRVLQMPNLVGKLVARIVGSSNIVHVVDLYQIKLVIRVPATARCGAGMTEVAQRAMISQAQTMLRIRQATAIPVPDAYAIDITMDNVIRAPYVCMSFVPGRRVSEVWFNDAGILPREQMRLMILSSMAQVMAQFSSPCLEYQEIGSMWADMSGVFSPGLIYHRAEQPDGSLEVTEAGPFKTTAAFINHYTRVKPHGLAWDKAEARLLRALISCLPRPDFPPGYVLCPRDLESDNVLVDDWGNVTGILDWDLAHTMPRFVGYARYPSWIMRDWNPLTYGWPRPTEERDSFEALHRYRVYYNAELARALGWQGDWRFTLNAHIAEAIWIAMLDPVNRLSICSKFVQAALHKDSAKALNIIHDIGEDRYSKEDWFILLASLKRMIC